MQVEKESRLTIGKLIKRLFKFLCYYLGIYALLDRLFDVRGVYIVYYHRLVTRGTKGVIPAMAVRLEDFEKQAAYYRKKFILVSMDEAVRIMGSEDPCTGKYLVVTFDDGYKDNYIYGVPIFRKYGLKPIIYLTAGCVESSRPLWTDLLRSMIYPTKKERVELSFQELSLKASVKNFRQKNEIFNTLKNWMKNRDEETKQQLFSHLSREFEVKPENKSDLLLDWDEVRKLKESGADIGAHTLHHPILSKIPQEDATGELRDGKALIEQRTAGNVEHLAYPNGGKSDYGLFVKQEAAKYYQTAVTTIPGINRKGEDLYELKRIGLSYDMSLMDLKFKLLSCKIRHRLSAVRPF